MADQVVIDPTPDQLNGMLHRAAHDAYYRWSGGPWPFNRGKLWAMKNLPVGHWYRYGQRRSIALAWWTDAWAKEKGFALRREERTVTL